jgi:hypothetical protein
MTGLLLLLGFIAIVGGVLILVEVCDRALDENRPGYSRAWARVFGEDPDLPVSHVRTSTSPEAERPW